MPPTCNADLSTDMLPKTNVGLAKKCDTGDMFILALACFIAQQELVDDYLEVCSQESIPQQGSTLLELSSKEAALGL